MKRFLLAVLVLLLYGLVYSQEFREYELSNLSGRYLVGSDTLKSHWIPLYQAQEYLSLYMDVTTYDSTLVYLYYWPTNESLSSGDSTTDGYGEFNVRTWTLLDSLTDADSLLSGKLYKVLNDKDTSRITFSKMIQLIFITGADHDSLKFDSAPFIIAK